MLGLLARTLSARTSSFRSRACWPSPQHPGGRVQLSFAADVTLALLLLARLALWDDLADREHDAVAAPGSRSRARADIRWLRSDLCGSGRCSCGSGPASPGP